MSLVDRQQLSSQRAGHGPTCALSQKSPEPKPGLRTRAVPLRGGSASVLITFSLLGFYVYIIYKGIGRIRLFSQ